MNYVLINENIGQQQVDLFDVADGLCDYSSNSRSTDSFNIHSLH